MSSFIEIVGDYDPIENLKTEKYHYLTEREFLDNLADIYDPIFDPYTLKNALYIETFGNFSFLPVHCSMYMQDLFIRIGAYDIGPKVFDSTVWVSILATLPFNDTGNLNYTTENIYIYFTELNRIKVYGWERWVITVKACIEHLEDTRGIY